MRKGWQCQLVTLMPLVVTTLMVQGIRVYDCRTPVGEAEVIDLSRAEKCADPVHDFEDPTDVRVQILQSDDIAEVRGHRCAASVTRIVTRCGFDGISYSGHTAAKDDDVMLDRDQCEVAVRTHILNYEGHRLLAVYDTRTKHNFYTHGTNSIAKGCTGETFTRGGTIYPYSYEQTLLEVEVTAISGTVDHSTGTVLFRNGLKGQYDQRVLVDVFEGTLIWDIGLNICEEEVSQIYLGLVTLHRVKHTEIAGSVVIVENDNTQQFMGLALASPTHICNKACFSTQIAGFAVCLLREGDALARVNNFKPGLAGVVNNHLRSEVGFLHLSSALRVSKRFALIQSELCQLARELVQNRLHQLASGAGSLGFTEALGPGYTTSVAGAVVYVSKCTQLDVHRAEISNCTHEIPIRETNSTTILFAHPITRILQEYPTVVPCSDIYPVRWAIGGSWFCATPQAHLCSAPKKMSTSVTTFRALGNHTRGMGKGAYSEEQLLKHRLFQRTATSRQAVLGKLVNQATGSIGREGLGTVLDVDDLEAITVHVGISLLPLFRIVGHGYQIMTGCLLVLFLVKLLLGAFLRVATLYHHRGCGVWLLLALWETSYLLITGPIRFAGAALHAVRQPTHGVFDQQHRDREGDHHRENDDDDGIAAAELGNRGRTVVPADFPRLATAVRREMDELEAQEATGLLPEGADAQRAPLRTPGPERALILRQAALLRQWRNDEATNQRAMAAADRLAAAEAVLAHRGRVEDHHSLPRAPCPQSPPASDRRGTT